MKSTSKSRRRPVPTAPLGAAGPATRETVEARLKAAADRMVWALESALKVAAAPRDKRKARKILRIARHLKKSAYKALGEVAPEVDRPTRVEGFKKPLKALSRKLQ